MKAKSLMAVITSLALVVAGVFWCVPSAAQEAAPAAAQESMRSDARAIFLHHSTGECVWNGGAAEWLAAYNAANKTEYRVREQAFPKESPYGWENYPYDYWNIWVKHAGTKPYKGEPTLPILTKQHDVIVFKHCFPVSSIEPDTGRGDVASADKRIENYKLQYAALKRKMREFPKNRFIVWTGAALTKAETDQASAKRARDFFHWVKTEWDEKGDNIYVWDFHELETQGGLYLKDECASAPADSHPNERFSRAVAPCFGQRIVDVIQGRGDIAPLIGSRPKQVPEVAERPPAEPEGTEESAPEQPAEAPPAPSKVESEGKWVFDDAETEATEKRLWPAAAAYAAEGENHVVRLKFAEAGEEDWGEYGKHRVLFTRRPAENHDVSAYKYLALRMKSDRKMLVVLSLLTLPKPQGPAHQPYFAFTAYLRPEAGKWKWAVVDLAKLELAVEGPGAYTAAGEPTRPVRVTCLKFCTNKDNEGAAFLVDDITFLRELPADLKPFLQSP